MVRHRWRSGDDIAGSIDDAGGVHQHGAFKDRRERMRCRRGVQPADRAVKLVERKFIDRLRNLAAQAAHRPGLVDDQQVMGLAEAFDDGADVQRQDGAQVDDLGAGSRCGKCRCRLQRAGHHLPGGHDGDVGASPCNTGRTKGHIMRGHRHLAPGREKRLWFQHDHRVRRAQRGFHQPLGIGGVGRHADDQPRHMGKDRMVAAAVMRAGTAQRPCPGAHHHRRIHFAVAHVAQFGGLQENLARRLERKVREHQIRYRAGPGGRSADGGGGKALLGYWRVHHPLPAEFGPQVFGMGKTAAAFAGAFAKVQDRGIGAHFLGNAVAHRVKPALQPGRAGRLGPQRFGRVDRVGKDMVAHRRRIGFGRVAGKFQRLLHHNVDPGFDLGKVLGRCRSILLGQALAEHVDRIAPDPGIDFILGAVGADDRVAFVVADNAVGLGLDQGRPLARPRPFDSVFHREPDRKDIITVHRDTGHAVTCSPLGNLGVQGD